MKPGSPARAGRKLIPSQKGKTELKLKLIAIILLSLCLLSVSCSPVPDFDSQLGSIVKPYRFNFVKWELEAIPCAIGQWLFGNHEEIDDQTDTVLEYFSLAEQIKSLEWEIAAVNAGNEQGDLASLEAELNSWQEQKTALTDKVERIIASQIKRSWLSRVSSIQWINI